MKTSEEMISRMEALVRRLAKQPSGLLELHDDSSNAIRSDAKAIVAELDAPQTDEEWAAKFREECVRSAQSITDMALKAIAKGRELAKQEIEIINLNGEAIDVVSNVESSQIKVALKPMITFPSLTNSINRTYASDGPCHD